jgi:hypothetical protein
MIGKEEAIAKLRRQLDSIDELRRTPRRDPAFKKWHRDTEVAIERIFAEGTRHLKDFTGIRYSLMAFSSGTPDSEFERAYQAGLEQARSILQSFIDEIREYWDDAVTVPGTNPTTLVEQICRRFHLIARQLRSRHENRQTLEIEDEYDVQDLLHALLHLSFDDIRREECTPSYAGGSARMDFLLKREQLVVETKRARKNLGAREVGDQLLIDIQRYQTHPDCRTLVCFVYDPEGRVANPRGLEADLSGLRESIEVRTIVAPAGA